MSSLKQSLTPKKVGGCYFCFANPWFAKPPLGMIFFWTYPSAPTHSFRNQLDHWDGDWRLLHLFGLPLFFHSFGASKWHLFLRGELKQQLGGVLGPQVLSQRFIKNQHVSGRKKQNPTPKDSHVTNCDKWGWSNAPCRQVNHHLQGYLESLKIEIYWSWNRQFKSRCLLNILVLFVLSNTQTLWKRVLSFFEVHVQFNNIYIYIHLYTNRN